MKNLLLSFLTLALIIGCGTDEEGITPQTPSEWLIPSNEVFDGGPGKDGIPSIDNPKFSSVLDIDFLDDSDLVVGVVNGNMAKAYPHPILDWHEIVNDEIGDLNLAITYCPLTGTAVGWNHLVKGEKTTFGVSGKLYNSNLMPYDRATDSYWSQIGLNCVNGELVSEIISTYSVIETSWGTWKKLYPESLILNTETGFNRNYNAFPYGDYRTNHNNLIFPVSPSDNRLPAKERVLGVLETNAAKAYSIELFETPTVISDVVDGKEMIIIGSKELNFIVAYENDLGLENLVIDLNNLPVIASDGEGNTLRIDGRIQEGPLSGSQLKPLKSFIGYWFSFGAFYPDIEIYN